MPTNLLSPFDDFDSTTSHVLFAMIPKFHKPRKMGEITGFSQSVELWGSVVSMRVFLFEEDLADAVTFDFENRFPDNFYNVGTGENLTIKELAELIQKAVGHHGEIIWDSNKPDRTPSKANGRLQNGKCWKAKVSLEEGIK